MSATELLLTVPFAAMGRARALRPVSSLAAQAPDRIEPHLERVRHRQPLDLRPAERATA